jgi:hypothetical protein
MKCFNYEYIEGGKIGKESLEKLQEFRNMDWMDGAVIEKFSALMRELLARNNSTS